MSDYGHVTWMGSIYGRHRWILPAFSFPPIQLQFITIFSWLRNCLLDSLFLKWNCNYLYECALSSAAPDFHWHFVNLSIRYQERLTSSFFFLSTSWLNIMLKYLERVLFSMDMSSLYRIITRFDHIVDNIFSGIYKIFVFRFWFVKCKTNEEKGQRLVKKREIELLVALTSNVI